MAPTQTPIRSPNRVFKDPKTVISECRSHAYPETVRQLAVRARLLGLDMEDEFVDVTQEEGLC